MSTVRCGGLSTNTSTKTQEKPQGTHGDAFRSTLNTSVHHVSPRQGFGPVECKAHGVRARCDITPPRLGLNGKVFTGFGIASDEGNWQA
jgi:hypothetical protein